MTVLYHQYLQYCFHCTREWSLNNAHWYHKKICNAIISVALSAIKLCVWLFQTKKKPLLQWIKTTVFKANKAELMTKKKYKNRQSTWKQTNTVNIPNIGEKQGIKRIQRNLTLWSYLFFLFHVRLFHFELPFQLKCTKTFFGQWMRCRVVPFKFFFSFILVCFF